MHSVTASVYFQHVLRFPAEGSIDGPASGKPKAYRRALNRLIGQRHEEYRKRQAEAVQAL